MNKPALVHIGTPQEQTALTKEQRSFNRLTRQVEALRRAVQAWQAVAPVYASREAAELTPLLETCDRHRIELLAVLDRGHAAPGMTQGERSKLAKLICDMAAELLDEDDGPPEVLALHDKHSRTRFEDKKRGGADQLRALFDAVGVDASDLPPDAGFDEVASHLHAKLQHQEERPASTVRPRKPSAKALAKQALQRADEQRVAQSLRDIFRKLASALHPDREADVKKREHKNALMQEVNAAYAREDLLRLLELQIEVGQIDAAAADARTFSDAHVKHFNKILKDQVGELEQELHRLQMQCGASMPLSPAVDASVALQGLDRLLQGARSDLRQLQRDVVELADVKKLKGWLRSRRFDRDAQDDEFILLFAGLAAGR